jgi:hypothetical protein
MNVSYCLQHFYGAGPELLRQLTLQGFGLFNNPDLSTSLTNFTPIGRGRLDPHLDVLQIAKAMDLTPAASWQSYRRRSP